MLNKSWDDWLPIFALCLKEIERSVVWAVVQLLDCETSLSHLTSCSQFHTLIAGLVSNPNPSSQLTSFSEPWIHLVHTFSLLVQVGGPGERKVKQTDSCRTTCFVYVHEITDIPLVNMALVHSDAATGHMTLGSGQAQNKHNNRFTIILTNGFLQ